MKRSNVSQLVPAIRMIASGKEILTARWDDREAILEAQQETDLKKIAGLRADASVLILPEINDPASALTAVTAGIAQWQKNHPTHPDYILIRNSGLVILASNAATLDYLSGVNDQVKPTIEGRLENKIVLVTGGAQGFGEGIAEELFLQGANIVIADLNSEAGNRLVERLNRLDRSNRAFFVQTNVADAPSVEAMVEATVRHFGGLDVLISNAGILRAGGLEEMTPEVFALMTDVNYKAYFLCAKYGSSVMKLQTKYRKDYFSDIIQINSKSGLKGSNRNFAYAGGKFGGIGLTQSFALELMPHHIKVNSICPGNFFEGPLWSDPTNGLFVQYLKAGKVPGAKTIEEVKAFYEAQVPAGRGCRVIDVVRAIYYLIEQEYETGQAVPVTGGQNMLN